MVPINGGIFAVILMLMFLSGLVEGAMFPEFYHFEFEKNSPESMIKSVYLWFSTTLPSSGEEVAKLLFWSFVSGFSERFVPQIIRKTTRNNSQPATFESENHNEKPENGMQKN